jgi:RNA polymerase sigma-70 factor (ECF subfamily)
MSDARPWQPERYRALLRLQAQQMRLDPRLRRRFDASDLAHDALARALEALPQFRGGTEGEFVAWLQQILANVAVDRARRERAQKRDVALEQSIHAAVAESSARWDNTLAGRQEPPDRQAERRELLLRLAEAIDRLPDDQREVVVCRDLMRMPVADIAGQLGRTEKSVASLLLRGRRKLRELLPDDQP